MKTSQFIALIFSILLLFQVGEDVVLRLWYQLDNDSFTETFCENIDAPQLECKGSCFIGYQLESSIQEQIPLHKTIVPSSALEAFLVPPILNFLTPPSFTYSNIKSPYSFITKEWILPSPQPPPEV